MDKIVVFELDNQQYGVDIQYVKSVEQLLEITYIPQVASFIKGIIHLRGQAIPIIDLKEYFHQGKTTLMDQTKILLVNIKNIQVGFLIDSATEVLDLDKSTIDTSIEGMEGLKQSFIKGVVKLEDNLLILLDLENILMTAEIDQLQKVTEDTNEENI